MNTVVDTNITITTIMITIATTMIVMTTIAMIAMTTMIMDVATTVTKKIPADAGIFYLIAQNLFRIDAVQK
jgi:hypothetical protein